MFVKGNEMSNIIEVYPNNYSGYRFERNGFFDYEQFINDVKAYESGLEWYEEGNELVVLLNEDYDELGKNLALYDRFGTVYCLADRFGTYVTVDCDEDRNSTVNQSIRKILEDEAVQYGFPRECPRKPDKAWAVTFSLTLSMDDEWVQAKTEDEAAEIVRKAMRNSDFLDWIKNRFQRDLDDSYEMDGFTNVHFALSELPHFGGDEPINMYIND